MVYFITASFSLSRMRGWKNHEIDDLQGCGEEAMKVDLKDTTAKYYYYHMKYFSGESGWRISKNIHPLRAADLKKGMITFWSEIDRFVARDVFDEYEDGDDDKK